jgi:DHA1 family bicyclomycin/chloramphenicol resistance-like MFS transporter
MTTRKIGSFEFIVLVALLNALVAMSIDTMLPAIGQIAAELNATNPNDRQLIITLFFAGMMVGTLIWGPLSDATGRRPAIFTSLACYGLGTLICFFAWSFPVIIIGRLVQGFGAAGPRIVSIAMVRDGQSGAAMARVMSFVMSVFMLVPILAPSIGQLVLLVADWRVIFLGFLVIAALSLAWVHFRQQETLPPERRNPLQASPMLDAAWQFLRHPVALGYTIAVGFIFAAFINYLGTSQQIFAEQYAQGEWFAVWFGVFAVAIAFAMILNGRLVVRLGMRRLSKYALRGEIALALAFLIPAALYAGHPPLWMLGVYLFATFFCCGILFGNYNALAMEPMGRIAGMAAAMSGFLSTLVAIVFGGTLGQFYNGTVLPLVLGYGAFGLLALLFSEWAERRRT